MYIIEVHCHAVKYVLKIILDGLYFRTIVARLSLVRKYMHEALYKMLSSKGRITFLCKKHLSLLYYPTFCSMFKDRKGEIEKNMLLPESLLNSIFASFCSDI